MMRRDLKDFWPELMRGTVGGLWEVAPGDLV